MFDFEITAKYDVLYESMRIKMVSDGGKIKYIVFVDQNEPNTFFKLNHYKIMIYIPRSSSKS